MANTFGALKTAIYSKFTGNAALVAALGGSTGLDAYRLFADRAPERPIDNYPDEVTTIFPYVVFTIPSGQPEDTLSEEGEVLTVQFNIYDYDEDSPDDDSTINNIYHLLDSLYNKCSLSITHYVLVYMLRQSVITVPTTDDTQQITVIYEVMMQYSSSSSSSSSSSLSSSSSSSSGS